ncbi:MAG: PhnD/SsuA/transferrin family substrate-binding protein [Anaerolineales bacterium]|nr:PhnD/SsuA/transferrin family substrate-binding protein [Anaerolineales bacterium]
MYSTSLRITTIQAQNSNFVIEQIAGYIGKTLGMPVKFIVDPPCPERERQLDSGDIDIGWICGLPYIGKADQANPTIELLVAPVMQAARYRDRPVYYSDLVVHHDSGFQQFADLRGASWAPALYPLGLFINLYRKIFGMSSDKR